MKSNNASSCQECGVALNYSIIFINSNAIGDIAHGLRMRNKQKSSVCYYNVEEIQNGVVVVEKTDTCQIREFFDGYCNVCPAVVNRYCNSKLVFDVVDICNDVDGDKNLVDVHDVSEYCTSSGSKEIDEVGCDLQDNQAANTTVYLDDEFDKNFKEIDWEQYAHASDIPEVRELCAERGLPLPDKFGLCFM